MTAPSEALETSLAYLPNTPLVTVARRLLVGGDARGDLVVGQVDVEAARGDVDRDRVAVLDRGDRAAVGGLGRDVGDHEAVGGAGEAAVGDERDVVAEPLPHERAGDREHLAHPGAAGGALVADDDDVAGHDPARR